MKTLKQNNINTYNGKSAGPVLFREIKGVKEILMNVISKVHLAGAKAHSAWLCVTHGFSKPCLFSLLKFFTEWCDGFLYIRRLEHREIK